MPTFREFEGAFKKEYTEEEKQTYRMIHGNDENEWPGNGDYDPSPVCIDLERVVTFNQHIDEDKTTVEVATGSRYAIKMRYDMFKKILINELKLDKNRYGI